jgi:spore maturation protein CgeB
MKTLLVDTTLYAPVSPLLADALDELGYEHRFVDEAPFTRPLDRSVIQKIGYRLLRRRPLTSWQFNRTLLNEALRFQPRLMLAVKGAYIRPAILRRIKQQTGAVLVNYATDDPFNRANATPDLTAGIPFYDLYACTKRAIMEDVRRAGCPNVAFVRFAYKPSVHFPESPATAAEAERFRSDVVLVGGADADRLPYVEALAGEPALTLALYGGYWNRYSGLRGYARGFAVGRDYRLALGASKIALCLVRRANRDGHAMRSLEIPACGAFMLAERTEEHLELYREGQDAAFFETKAELVEKVRYYLSHEEERRRIAHNGFLRVTGGRHTYRDRMRDIAELAAGLM